MYELCCGVAFVYILMSRGTSHKYFEWRAVYRLSSSIVDQTDCRPIIENKSRKYGLISTKAHVVSELDVRYQH